MIDSNLSEKLGYDFQVLKNYVDNYQPVEELKWVSNEKDRRFIRKLEDAERENFDLGWYELKKARPELQITYPEFVDNKIMIDKQPRKLFKYLNDKDLSELVGKYKLPKTDLYLVISTNFDDFMMCSTGNNWTACTDLRTGDFRYTTLGNVFTKGRFIVYITDLKPKEFEGLQSYNMFFRCFGFVNEDGQLVTNIWYPIKEYMAVDSLGVKSVKEVISKKSKYGFDIVYNKFDSFIYPYLDYSVFDDNTFAFKDEYLRYDPKILFSNGDIASYSECLKFEGEFGYDGFLWRKCDCCGEKKGFIKTYGDVNLCPSCYDKYEQTCWYDNKKHLLKTMYFTENNHWLSVDAAKIYSPNLTVCSCGTLIKKKKEIKCKFCRSDKVDAFKNNNFSYLHDGNLYTYFKHHYIEGDKLPPGIKYDEEVFEETEKYMRRGD